MRYTRERLETEIDECITEMCHIRERLAELYSASVFAENQYRQAKARAYCEVVGKNAAEREANVVLATEAKWLTANEFEVRITQAREELGIQKAILEGLRTLAANMRNP